MAADPPLVARLKAIVGRRHVLTGAAARPYATGYRFGSGPVAAAARPGSLVELWRVLVACVAADHIIIVQAANTGLTGGSTPDGVYDRGVVVISTNRIRGIHLLRGGAQAVCLAGASLHELERKLAPLGREPHSVIGSSCLGASVIGGVCNNSGGALVRRGPAYTEYALYARIDEQGDVRLHNHLGLEFGADPEAMLERLEAGQFGDEDIVDDGKAASARDYCDQVRHVDSAAPARFNADPARLFEASGSAGRIVVFAVRLDTFPAVRRSATFYLGTNDPLELTAVRRRILREFASLPVSGEYIHRDAFDLAAACGKDVVLAIRHLGTDRLPLLFAAKNWVDSAAKRLGFLPDNCSDRLMQAAARLFPEHLPERMRGFRDRFEHHLVLKMADEGVEEARALLGQVFPSAAGEMFECTAEEAEKAFLHRFAVAGAAVRYRALHPETVADIVALDVALRRDDPDWFTPVPPELAGSVVGYLVYGHFFCHVFHLDYIVAKGADPVALEHRLLEQLDACGAEYPAEHNVGHLYPAKPSLVEHYRALDPGNRCNPGIGKTSREPMWGGDRSGQTSGLANDLISD